MTKNQQIQRLYRAYKEETGTLDVDLKQFAKWMQKKGWKMPTPADPIDLLAKQVAEALRDETRKDEVTGLPYKVNLNYSTSRARVERSPSLARAIIPDLASFAEAKLRSLCVFKSHLPIQSAERLERYLVVDLAAQVSQECHGGASAMAERQTD